ncbi:MULTISPECIES: hypothetical protein [Cuniculiplasmataceae]|uniref:hypothetical protein n=1 Tax=Cuniculiplasma sp. SKW4 TaxID=3400171 RepID=UPI003FD41225
MSSNHLEELAKEYYEYKGYFVRPNVHVGKREDGGYNGEIDLLAYHPAKRELLHVECSMDSGNKSSEEEMAEKKFHMDIDDYKRIMPFDFNNIRKIYIIGQTKGQNEIKMPRDVEHISVGPFIKEVYNDLPADIMNEIVPEVYPLLRSIQLVKWAKPEKS